MEKSALSCLGAVLLGVSGCSDAPPCQVDPQFVEDVHGNAACIIQRNSEILAILHRASGRLDLPGGRSQASETAQCTAHRETWEETGLNVVVGSRILAPGDASVYRCTLSVDPASVEEFPISPVAMIEVADVTWVNPRETQVRDWRYRSQLRTIWRAVAPD